MSIRLAAHDRTSVDHYLQNIGRIPMLTHDEEITLGRMIQRGIELEAVDRDLTPTEKAAIRKGRRAKDRMVAANLRLVVFAARKHMRRGLRSLDLLDVIQEGNTGLVRAAEKFDPARGYKFSTYAYWWIRQAITRATSQQAWLIRRPHHIAEIAAKLPKTYAVLTQKLHRSPTQQEMADALGVSVEELELLRHRGGGYVSLDATVLNDNDSSRLIDLIVYENDLTDEDMDDVMVMDMRKPALEAAMAHLTEQEHRFIRRKYGLDDGRCWTNVEQAKDEAARNGANLSRERVRQILVRAERKLKFYMADAALNPLAVLPPSAAPESATAPPPAQDLGSQMLRLLMPPLPESLPLEERQALWKAPTPQCA